MSYTSYASAAEYLNLGLVEIENIETALITASHHIDALTFNRIVKIGFDNLTDWQKSVVKESTCKLAEFEEQNKEALQSLVSGYSINGVSVQYGTGLAASTVNGVAIRQDIYQLLKQSGLCSLNMGGVFA